MSSSSGHTTLSAEQAAGVGMGLAVSARSHPDRLAIASSFGDRSFDALNRRANQLVRALRARGLVAGDPLALLCANRPEFAVAFFAALRGGFRLTPIDCQLTAEEAAFILGDCEARAFLGGGGCAPAAAGAVRSLGGPAVRLAIGDPVPGFESFDEALEEQADADIEDPTLGGQMLYTSGTTGRPRGVLRPPGAVEREPGLAAVAACARYAPGDLHLCTGPLSHTAPLAFSLVMPLSFGCGVVMMQSFEAQRALELITGYRITHTHMVPTMFHRLLALPEEARRDCDLGSLRMLLHGAAPCPESVKRVMLDWFGLTLVEYYAATEGWGCLIEAEEWLEKPGSVGRPQPGQVEIRDAEAKPQPPGTPGAVHLRSPPGGRFEYFRDPEKTAETCDGDHFTLGDIGYLDADGYLFLCDRSVDVIIMGGVNVYPAEVDAALLQHPAIRDVATVGAPDEEWGEVVAAVVELRDGYCPSPELSDELMAHCRGALAHFKSPRRIEFAEVLPRHENGKILRREVRNRFWKGRKRQI